MLNNKDFCDYKHTVRIKYPKLIKNVLVFLEDKRFYTHQGYDTVAIKAALKANIKERKILYGASTITQQLAKNLFLTNEQTIKRKMKEFTLARKIEKVYSKDQILDLYLNNVEFMKDVKGMEEACKYYYKKNVNEIGFFESVCLLSLLKAPVDYNPKKNIELNKKAREKSINTLLVNNVVDKKDAKKLASLDFWDNDIKLDNKYKKRIEALYTND
ncbi:MAG: biosynthetic peptidoglycan transglycosylase [Coriobacteriia bacterium]|nr:biosynthetic peptidoglycan transglycosylase [Coriobacteriia bacterium]